MDGDNGTGRRRLPGCDDWAADARVGQARVRRADGVRRVRTMSNWTAAALVAGVAVTTGYFAHAATVATQVPGYSGASGQGQPGTAATGHKASLTHPVATSGGSGVTAGSGGAGGSGGSSWRDN
jgi:hypothetical protein